MDPERVALPRACNAEAMRHRGQPAVAARAIVAGGFGLFSSNDTHVAWNGPSERWLSVVRCGHHELLFSRRSSYQGLSVQPGFEYQWETLMRRAVGDGWCRALVAIAWGVEEDVV